MPAFELTVLHAFGQYAKGAPIWAEDEIKAILGSEHALHVLKVPPGTHEAMAEAAEAVVQVVATAIDDATAQAKAAADALAAKAKAKADADVKAVADAAAKLAEPTKA